MLVDDELCNLTGVEETGVPPLEETENPVVRIGVLKEDMVCCMCVVCVLGSLSVSEQCLKLCQLSFSRFQVLFSSFLLLSLRPFGIQRERKLRVTFCPLQILNFSRSFPFSRRRSMCGPFRRLIIYHLLLVLLIYCYYIYSLVYLLYPATYSSSPS